MKNRKNDRAKKTQRQQAAAKPKLHPRGLARSVAKYLGASKYTWRDQVAALPRTGQKYLYPWKHNQIDCSGCITGTMDKQKAAKLLEGAEA